MIKLHLGVGRTIITPKLGTFLAGYGASGRDAESINDDLTATAFCFQFGDTYALLISLTLTLLDGEISNIIRNTIENNHKIPRTNIIVHTMHTHSGPLTFTKKGWGAANTEYIQEILIPQTLRAVDEAITKLQYVTVSISAGTSNVGINRRELTQENQIILGQCDYGCFDPKMTVISFADEVGKCVANLVHYGCHATAAGSNLQISRDWPGVMIDRLEAESGGITAFVNGTEGDVGPRLTNGRTTGRKDIRYALEHGCIAAADAVAIYKNAVYKDMNLKCISRTIRIPVDRRISYEEASQKLQAVNDPNPQHAARIRLHYQEVMQSYETDYQEVPYAEFEQTAIQIGDAVFVTSPFETFSEIGLRIRKYSSIPHVLCTSMSNGCESYFPTKGELSRGGYEVKCFKTERIQPLVDDADFAFIQQTLQTLEQLGE